MANQGGGERERETTFESLRVSGEEFVTLDQTLCVALMAIVPTTLERTLMRKEEAELVNHQSTMTGRQVLWHILHYLRVDPTLSNFYSVEDLNDAI